MLNNNIFGLVVVISLCIDAGAPQIETDMSFSAVTAIEGNEEYEDVTRPIDQVITTAFKVTDEYYEDNVTSVDAESKVDATKHYPELVIEEVTAGFYEEIMNITTIIDSESNLTMMSTTALSNSALIDKMDNSEDAYRSKDSPVISNFLAADIDTEELEQQNNVDRSQYFGDEPEEIYHMQCKDRGNLVLSGYKRIYFPMVVNNAQYIENVSLPTVMKGNFPLDFAACEFVRLSPIMLQVKIYSRTMEVKDFDCPLFPNNTDEERHLEWLPLTGTRIITLEFIYRGKTYSKRIFTGGYVVGNSCYASYFHDCLQSDKNITCFGANCPACMPFHLTFNLIDLHDPERPGKIVPLSSKHTSSASSLWGTLWATVGYFFGITGFILLVSWVFFILLLRFRRMLAVGFKFNHHKTYTEGEWPQDEDEETKHKKFRTPSFIGKLYKSFTQRSVTDVERELSSENSADKAGRRISPFMGRKKRYTKKKPEGAPCIERSKQMLHITEHPEPDHCKKRRKLKNIYEDEIYETTNQDLRVRKKVAGTKPHRKHAGHAKRPK